MSYRFDFHERVANDSLEVYKWYEYKTHGLGEHFLEAVKKKLEQVAKNPEAFGERSKKGYREAALNTFPYMIVYKIYKKSKVIFVNSIHHTSRNPHKKFRK